MASQSEKEMDHIISDLSRLKGSLLVRYAYNEKSLQLGFEAKGALEWLCFSLKPGAPYFFSSQNRIFLSPTLKKPLSLFLKTHFVNKSFISIDRNKDLGRVVEITLEGNHKIIISLFPGGQNIELISGKKNVYAYKPKEIVKKDQDSSFVDSTLRSSKDFEQQWQNQNQPQKQSANKSVTLDDKSLKKKQKGLEQMLEKLESLKKSDWLDLGEWLKSEQNLDSVPQKWEDKVDETKSLSWNIEKAFEQHKKNLSKMAGTEERVELLKEEIESLKSGEVKANSKKSESLMHQSEAKGRTWDLGEHRLYMGKSGKDNLSLLRKAKPWYLWLHIQDYPGTHGVIERQKKQEPSRELIEKAALLVIKQSVGESAKGSFAVVIAECRYVKPIKGAKSGQVTYSHEKVIHIKV